VIQPVTTPGPTSSLTSLAPAPIIGWQALARMVAGETIHVEVSEVSGADGVGNEPAPADVPLAAAVGPGRSSVASAQKKQGRRGSPSVAGGTGQGGERGAVATLCFLVVNWVRLMLRALRVIGALLTEPLPCRSNARGASNLIRAPRRELTRGPTRAFASNPVRNPVTFTRP
jgi:hypothetical protein